MRVVVTDVGGGFGVRGAAYPEDVCVLWASRRLARPVRWTAERSEGLISDLHGRDRLDRGEAAFDRDGRLLAIRSRTVVNVGAYLNQSAGNPAANAARPRGADHIRTASWTSTASADMPARWGFTASWKPENQLFLEKLMIRLLRQLGVEPIELRRRDSIPGFAMSHNRRASTLIDSRLFRWVLRPRPPCSPIPGFAARRAESLGRGRLRGFGVGVHILPAASSLLSERMEIGLRRTAHWRSFAAPVDGQGHTTMYAMMLSDWL